MGAKVMSFEELCVPLQSKLVQNTLCNLVGNDIENGLIPYTGYEEQRVNQMIEDICYNNANKFFNF